MCVVCINPSVGWLESQPVTVKQAAILAPAHDQKGVFVVTQCTVMRLSCATDSHTTEMV